MKDWQLGFDFDALKLLSAPFQSAGKEHSYGAFGPANERAVALAWSKARLVYGQAFAGGPPAVAAIKRKLTAHRQHTDFAGRAWKINSGDVLVSELGAHAGAERLAAQLVEACAEPGRVTWVQVFEENTELRDALRRAGYGWWCTKVKASSDLIGVYRKPAAAWPIEAAELPGLACLALEFLTASEIARVLEEIHAYERFCNGNGEAFAQHYSSYNKRHSWQAFAIRGYQRDDPHMIEKPAEMSKGWKAKHPELLRNRCEPTIAASHFPQTLALLDRIGAPVERARFMMVTEGGELTRHADITNPDAGVRDGKLARLHIPIQTPPECLFLSWDLRGNRLAWHMRAAGLYYLDQRKPHSVVNPAKSKRIHLVIDVFANAEIRAQIKSGELRNG